VQLVDVLLLLVAAAGVGEPSLAYRVPGVEGFTYYPEPLLVVAMFSAVLLAMLAASLASCTFCTKQCHGH